ncbi:MAG: response regulator [Rhodocyclaceae bacterium]|nr:response regulator [Rhodocyclaceae bacterium]
MDLRDKSGLLIDDLADMRNAMRIQLADGGLDRCDMARNVKEAVAKLTLKRYDLIVCDYALGQGADGQQLLELLRRRQLMPLSTAFLMVTGESGYEQVATAAEYAPDDYLIKPFTSATLQARLVRILEKKAALMPVYRHLPLADKRGDPEKALAACDELLAGDSRYQFDVLRLKGDLLIGLERPDEALQLYEGALQQRETPWAAVGRARALAALGRTEEASENLHKALDAYPNYLAAYDSLAALLEKSDKGAAQDVVERALKVAPSTQRTRRLGGLALENKDFARAETAFRRAVDKDRSGFFKSHDDYAGLAKSCSEQGKTKEALGAIQDMGQHFVRTPELAARQAAVECQVQAKAGNTAAAEAALQRALQLGKEARLDPNTALEVAQACFVGGRADEARRLIEAVAEDHHENVDVLDRAQSVFAHAGLGDEGAVLLEATRKRMIKLNNDAIAMSRRGELDQAMEMLTEAADRLRNNCQVSINAAAALLTHIQRNGMNMERLERARGYIDQAQRANPTHPRLAEISDLYRKVAPADASALDESGSVTEQGEPGAG